jgi:hypothetical protein
LPPKILNFPPESCSIILKSDWCVKPRKVAMYLRDRCVGLKFKPESHGTLYEVGLRNETVIIFWLVIEHLWNAD